MQIWKQTNTTLTNPTIPDPIPFPLPEPLAQLWQTNPELLHYLEATSSEKLHRIWHTMYANQCQAFFTSLTKQIPYYTASNHPVSCFPSMPYVIWQEGCSRLLDYGSINFTNNNISRPRIDTAPIIFCIPSLINGYQILDLRPDLSFVRFLTQSGYRVLVLDWGNPSPSEYHFTLDHYMQRAVLAFEFCCKHFCQKATVFGYCMGGILALALAQLQSRHISRLVLCATPWDFKAPGVKRLPSADSFRTMITHWLRKQPVVTAPMVQSFFYLLYHAWMDKKFQEFSILNSEDPMFDAFLAVEHWANHGMDMTVSVASTCLMDWMISNKLARGKWRCLGKSVDPTTLLLPAEAICFIQGSKDHLVLATSTAPLQNVWPEANKIISDTGHIGLMAGQQVKAQCWEPLVLWLDEG